MNCTAHCNHASTLGMSGMGTDFDKGVRIGMKTMSTPYGIKQVEH